MHAEHAHGCNEGAPIAPGVGAEALSTAAENFDQPLAAAAEADAVKQYFWSRALAELKADFAPAAAAAAAAATLSLTWRPRKVLRMF